MKDFEKYTDKSLIDPMVVEDEKIIDKKKDTWGLIFLLCPEQAEELIKAYDDKGPEVLSKAKIIIDYET